MLLKKFDGVIVDFKTRRRFKIIKFLNYLIVNYLCFIKNNFFVEKNLIIVMFLMWGLNFVDYILVLRGDENLVTYDLIVNIVYDGAFDDGSYCVMVYYVLDKNWYEM